MQSFVWLWFLCISETLCGYSDIGTFLTGLDRCQQDFFSCESGSRNVYCSCDRKCVYYDNCCYDAAAIKEGRKTMSEEDQHRQYLERTTCETVDFRNIAKLRQGAFMISSCPESWDGDMDTKQACELYTDTDVRDILETDVRDLFPVVDISINVTFKNRQCAKCHGVQRYMPWLLEMECLPESLPLSSSVNDMVMMKLHSDRCSYRFIPPYDVTVHYCYEDFDYMITSNISEVDNSTCRDRIFNPVMIKEQVANPFLYFRNLQCLIAYRSTTHQSIFNITNCAINSLYIKQSSSSMTLSSLIDFSSLFQRKVTKCKEQQIELSNEVGCHRLYCPAHSEPAGEECVDVAYISDGFILDLLFEVNILSQTDRSILESLLIIMDSFKIDIRNHTGSHIFYNTIHLRNLNFIPGIQLNNEICSVIHILLPLKGITLYGDILESERSWVSKYFNNFTKRNSDGSIMRHVDTQNMSCKTNVSVRDPSYIQEVIPVDNDLPCPAVKLQLSGNESDSKGEINNSSLPYFHLEGIIISPLDVVFANGDFFVCVDTFLSKYHVIYQQNDMDSYRSYINTTCASISIICMIYCLVQYCVVPIFRHGKSDLLIVLVLFLLLAQTFFLLSLLAVPNNVCEWVGIIHHFTWLGAFLFMFLCPYRFNAELRDLRTFSKSERMIVTVKYLLVGMFLPVFVIICIQITNLILAPTEKWYGGRPCFITQTFVLLFGFVIPVACILCGNVFLFISIIRYISTTSSSANSNKSNLVIFMKISTFMGFSWIIGIVAIMSQSDVLLLVFEVLSNLQGAFITISFSCTNRVRQFYKDCFH